MQKQFKIDNINYEFNAFGNTISFAILRGTSKKGVYIKRDRYALFDNDNEFDDLDLCLSPFKVLAKVKEFSLQWIRQSQPYMFTFSASTPRKKKIYDRLVFKALKNNPDIRDKYYFLKNKSGDFSFYQKQNAKKS